MTSKIDRLELYNFKSYLGHAVIGPFLDFTCIVGPNGSGKSNLMDALGFVLGANTATTLRSGAAVLDLVNRKAKKKECSVTVVLRQPNGSEARLTRSIDPQGKVTTTVDKINVGEKEFHAVLKKYHLGARIGTYLVFQHEVDAVAGMKDKDITELLEQVSGSAELKDQYNSRRTALDHANSQLASASSVKRGALAELNEMRLHKREAERYRELYGKCQEARRDLALTELFHVESTLTKQKKDLQAYTEEVKRLQEGVASESDVVKMKQSYAEKHKQYMEQLKKNREVNVQLRDKKGNLERFQISLNHLKDRLQNLSKEKDQARSAETVRSKEAERLRTQLKQQEALLAAFEEQCAKEDSTAASNGGKNTLTPAQLQEYRRLKKESDCQTISQRQELDTIARQRESLAEGLKHATLALSNHESAKKELLASVERNTARVKELKDRVDEIQTSQRVVKEEHTSVSTNVTRMQQRAAEQTTELAKVQQQLHELRFVKDDNRQATRMSDALQSLVSIHGSGIKGRLVDLCAIPNEKYRNAVTVAFGKHLEAIVVDTTATAMACVRYLKDQRSVVMTFLPLNAVQGKAVDDSLRTFGGTTRPIVDVLKFDAMIEPAVRYAVGQTLVCDGMDEAKRVAFEQPDGQRHKVVTVDGTVLLKNGSIQGGLASIQNRSRRWDEKKYDDLKAARDKMLKEIAGGSDAELTRAQCQLKDLTSRMEFNAKRLEALQAEIKQLEAKGAALTKEVAKQSEGTQALEKRMASYRSAIASCETQVAKHEEAIRKIESKIFSAFQAEVNIPHIAEFEQREQRQAKQRAERRQQLQLVVQKLKTSIEAENANVGRSDVDQVITTTNKEITVAQKDFQTYKGLTETLEKQQAALQTQITTSKGELTRLEAEILKSSKTSEDGVRQLAQVKKQVSSLQSSCDGLRLQRLALFQRCHMEETELPTVHPDEAGQKRARTSESTVSAPKRKAGASSSTSDVDLINTSEPFSTLGDADASGRRSKEVKVCIDFTPLSEALRLQAIDRASFQSYKQRAESGLDQLEREMGSIAPNLKASDRFGATESKLGTSVTNLEEARERARQALIEFTKVKELRVARFTKSFTEISKHVEAIYKELTMGTRAHGVHGTAYLELMEADEPYLGGTRYHATPPMKRYMHMEGLSGGERTMAALALLFAIHAASPTPFFVLDEVDAALDIGNVERLASYLRTHAAHVQFIVVSLKEQLYHMADGLIGVYKDKERESSSNLTLDIRGYPFASQK